MSSRSRFGVWWLCVIWSLLVAASPLRADEAPADDALADAVQDASPVPPSSLSIHIGDHASDQLLLLGSDARQQLVVTGHASDADYRDVTRDVQYTVQPPGVVSVDSVGVVRAEGDGRATISVQHPAGARAACDVEVRQWGNDPPVNFPNQVVPVFTKLGCNGGNCHGKSSGQNGFRLSLLGFEPPEDYEHLLKEARGRRLFPAAPERSLLLLKATAAVPHGGGRRLEEGEPAYRLLRRWISEGIPYGDPEAAKVAAISVFPDQRTLHPHEQQQLAVTAHYTDGSTEDVTSMAQYEANVEEMAEVGRTGLVTTSDLTGDVAVMVRYQSQVAVFRATVPLGAPVADLPAENNFIDELVFQKLRDLGMPPSRPCDDATFLRRSTIDIAGRLPTVEETRAFLDSDDPNKRITWVDQLLDSWDYADHFAEKWSAILRNKRRNDNYRRGTYAFHHWIRDSIHNNKPYDAFVREIITATGEIGHNPPVAWYREVNELSEQVEDTAQLFLGQRIQCARCHHHPFEKWSQQDYYSFAAFFSQVGRKAGDGPEEQRIFHKRGVARATNPKTNAPVKPAGLGAPIEQLAPENDPREALADWMTQPDNPFFARALVNRYWKHFFDRGLVDPEDDLRATNPAANPELLDALAEHFVATGFNMEELIRLICQSQVYQLESTPNEFNAKDKQNFSRYYPKRLSAEVLLDAVDAVCGATTSFAGLPPGTRAVQLPDTDFDSYFLTVFGRPEATSACECERQSEASLAQALHLINSAEIHGKLSAEGGRAARLASDNERTRQQKIEEVFLSSLSRAPTDDEVTAVAQYIERKSAESDDGLQRAYEDVLWTMINTKEFLFNH